MKKQLKDIFSKYLFYLGFALFLVLTSFRTEIKKNLESLFEEAKIKIVVLEKKIVKLETEAVQTMKDLQHKENENIQLKRENFNLSNSKPVENKVAKIKPIIIKDTIKIERKLSFRDSMLVYEDVFAKLTATKGKTNYYPKK